MNWLMFLQLWFLIGVVSILHRKKMIYEEDNARYRLMLIVLSAPVGLTLSIVFGAASSSWAWLTFMASAYRGEAPE